MSHAMIELDDTAFGYGGRPILEHVTFAIERGEFVALVGPNGAGKTTLLRGILGLIPVVAGRIERHFDRVASPPAYVPQRDSLDPIFPLSALEVVVMGTYAKLRPLRPVSRRLHRLAATCLAEVGLADSGRRPFWSLSGGQKQRVLIARALAVESDLMVLDEPTAGVDREAEASITALITRLSRERGLTIVMVTHHFDRIRSRVQAVVWVDRGRAVKKSAGEIPLTDAGMVPVPNGG
jgi:ABC-type Mn2+/Zn2+ transport system ATPase subunit